MPFLKKLYSKVAEDVVYGSGHFTTPAIEIVYKSDYLKNLYTYILNNYELSEENISTLKNDYKEQIADIGGRTDIIAQFENRYKKIDIIGPTSDKTEEFDINDNKNIKNAFIKNENILRNYKQVGEILLKNNNIDIKPKTGIKAKIGSLFNKKKVDERFFRKYNHLLEKPLF